MKKNLAIRHCLSFPPCLALLMMLLSLNSVTGQTRPPQTRKTEKEIIEEESSQDTEPELSPAQQRAIEDRAIKLAQHRVELAAKKLKYLKKKKSRAAKTQKKRLELLTTHAYAFIASIQLLREMKAYQKKCQKNKWTDKKHLSFLEKKDAEHEQAVRQMIKSENAYKQLFKDPIPNYIALIMYHKTKSKRRH